MPSPVTEDDRVLEAVEDLVRRGEYLDQIPGVPGADPDRAGVFLLRPDGRRSRIYDRNSDEFSRAKTSGLIKPLDSPPHPPATQELIAEAERAIGQPLPGLLRRLYLEVANGGFGPSHGLLGVGTGHGEAPDETALDRYRELQSLGMAIPESLFPVCDWGCAILSLVDCADPSTQMWGFDPNPVDQIEHAFFPQEMGFTGWLQLWLSGRLYQPWAIQDHDTGAWRGATNDETEAALHEDH
ncbi:MAG: SMI1/KNR4 family protein [Actinomycetia bacterium]|nr:SMI1/KNR4 family protein [Actinomycetes bacterium]